jgi:hypothetical protein
MAEISRPFFIAISGSATDWRKSEETDSACLSAVVKNPGSVSKSVRPARHDIERRWIA